MVSTKNFFEQNSTGVVVVENVNSCFSVNDGLSRGCEMLPWLRTKVRREQVSRRLTGIRESYFLVDNFFQTILYYNLSQQNSSSA